MTTASAPSRLTERLDHPVVEVGELSVDVADLVLLGLLGGSWPSLENLASVGIALAAHPELAVRTQNAMRPSPRSVSSTD